MKKITKILLGGLGVSAVLATLLPSFFLKDAAKWTHQSASGRVDFAFAGDVHNGAIEARGKALRVDRPRWLLDGNHNQGVVIHFPVSYFRGSYQIILKPQGRAKEISLVMNFRGEDLKVDQQNKPASVRFENIRLNGKVVTQERTVCYADPFRYSLGRIPSNSTVTLTFDVRRPISSTNIIWNRLIGLFIACSLLISCFDTLRRLINGVNKKGIVQEIPENDRNVGALSHHNVEEHKHEQTVTKIPKKRANLATTAENATKIRPRVHYIDLVRGICAVSIVSIHTCFWSGGGYVPMPMRTISVLLDVPAFFFIAGMTRAYIQKDAILNQLFKLSMVFVLLGLLCNLIDGEITWASVFRPLFLIGVNTSSLFKVVPGSYWFVPYYACTIIMGGVIIKHTRGGYLAGVISLIVLSYVLDFAGVLNFGGYNFFGCRLSWLLFPVASYLFGYWCQQYIVPAEIHKRRNFALLLTFVACVVFSLCCLCEGSSVYALELHKFPVRLPFIAASCFSMAGIIFFANNSLRNRFFEHIGRNAIFYYAGQGVSSSCLFLISPHIQLEWGIKLPIMFAINLALAIIFSEALRLVYTALASAIRADKKALLHRLLVHCRLSKAEE